MLRRFLFTIPTALAIFAIVLYPKLSPTAEPVMRVHGRMNTVLFLTTEATGLSNVHLAAASALLEHYPDVEVHYASFPKLASKVSRISASALASNPSAMPIQWHEIPGTPFLSEFEKHFGDVESMIIGTGTADYAKKIRDLVFSLAPWDAQDHWDMYTALNSLINDIDPAIVVLDNMLAPATDLAAHSDRRFLSLVPNGLLELIAADQPRGAVAWKYPAAFSGYQFPLSWTEVISNILLTIRLGYNLVNSPVLAAKRAFLVEKGIEKPIELTFVIKDVPVLASTLKEANFPMDFYPPYLKFCGHIAMSQTSAADQDPEMVSWLAQRPTILINLGSLFAYNQRRAQAMADALATLMAETDFQVLWKFKKLGDYGDEVFAGIQKDIDSRRIRIETWLETEPAALLETGHIVLEVHHGGANTYHEAILAGVPQMILPLWFDLFNFANIAEYLGIGIWAGRSTTPEWVAETLVEGFRTALVGPSSVSLREKAQKLGEVARQYDGRKIAADEIARLAAIGKETTK
ncbi:unnamed protein product [Clonostachys rosea f. rosea IK726]|uniref:UDP-glycosyltransferases domain-containing protein n=2 Tax=Bionectria ochroleuca TaxID=29856 RepID=A0A0B7KAV6_BIOOC|nr:unnamed protein product [Clonostachys rosea f. rosea IK726]